MWTCSQLKTNAKNVLGRFYWMALLTCVLSNAIVSAVGGAFSGIISVFTSLLSIPMTMVPALVGESDEVIVVVLAVLATIVSFVIFYAVILAMSVAVAAFVSYPMAVGTNYYFMRGRYGREKIEDIFISLKNGKYMNIVKISASMMIYIVLWSLLFIIPGYIKMYEYILIPYIMAENPDISKDRAFEISRKVMDGEKFNRFVLDLSFIGWWLLAIFVTCGIGMVFLLPYMQATYAEFYACMREKALSSGIATPEELPGFDK